MQDMLTASSRVTNRPICLRKRLRPSTQAGHQPQNRKGTRPYGTADAGRTSRRGDRIVVLFAAVHEFAIDVVDGSSTGT